MVCSHNRILHRTENKKLHWPNSMDESHTLNVEQKKWNTGVHTRRFYLYKVHTKANSLTLQGVTVSKKGGSNWRLPGRAIRVQVIFCFLVLGWLYRCAQLCNEFMMWTLSCMYVILEYIKKKSSSMSWLPFNLEASGTHWQVMSLSSCLSTDAGSSVISW